MDSIKIWNERWLHFNTSLYSSGSSIPAPIAEIFHIYEKHLVNKALNTDPAMKVLDVGAGSGRWTTTFAPKVAKVVAIEPTNAYYLLKKNIACFTNVECIKKSFDEYKSEEKFDLVIISGVLMYINDQTECDTFLSNALKMIAPGGHLVLREPVGRNRKCKTFKNGQNNGISNCINYMEITRPQEYYDRICCSYDFKLLQSIPVHATVLYHLHVPLLNKIYQDLMLKLFSRRHLAFWYLYNACFSRLEGFIRLVLNIPKIYIMFYRKKGQKQHCPKAPFTAHLIKHIEEK